jgi:hypothetical protein
MPYEALDFLYLVEQQKVVGQAPPIPADILEEMGERWRELAIAYTRLDPSRRLVAAPEHPGYLTTTCGVWQVFVPWPLVNFFPDNAVVEGLIAVGIGLAVPPPSTICISGSSAALGGEIAIGDLDFCQYVPLPPASIFEMAATFRAPAINRVMLTASFGTGKNAVTARRPCWQDWPLLESAMNAATSVAEADRFMLEFLENCKSFGLLPVSIVVLASDPTSRLHSAAKHSFVYQEAIAVVTGETAPSPAWTLVDPSQLAGYIEFLLKQMSTYAGLKPIKAVKRALSLVCTIRLHKFVDEVMDILESADAVAYVTSKRECEVNGLLRSLSAPEVARMEIPDRTIAVCTGQWEEKQNHVGLEQRARGLISRIAQEVDDITVKLGLISNGTEHGQDH